MVKLCSFSGMHTDKFPTNRKHRTNQTQYVGEPCWIVSLAALSKDGLGKGFFVAREGSALDMF